MKAPIPSNEARRRAALASYRILDTANERVYDDIVRLAAYICQVPIATISLVDEQRQWFKAKVGMRKSETPRDIAFCAHTILDAGPLIVEDATKDGRFADNDLVTHAPRIRFYAGFPLVNSDGLALGALCAIDRRRRQLDSAQKEAMKALSRQVMVLLEMRRISAHLADALAQVRTLRGLIPICAWCRKIRDDKGYWNDMEAYLRTSTGADFTHGICPECLEKERPRRA